MEEKQFLSANISIDAIEAQYETLNKKENKNRKFVFDEKKYLSLKLAPGEETKKIKIRILPVSANNPNLCVAVRTHSVKLSRRISKSGFKSFICLDDTSIPNYDSSVRCPLCKKSKRLFDEARALKEGGDEKKSNDVFKEACKYMSKVTYLFRVIERGKEDEGVKFWRFNANSEGEGYYDKLMNIYRTRKEERLEDDPNDHYNIFDLNNGHDIILTLTKTINKNGTDGVAVQVTDSSKDCPLSTDTEQADKWINDSLLWTDVYRIKNIDYLNIIAEEKIPYYDKNKDHYVGLTEEEFSYIYGRKEVDSKSASSFSGSETTVEANENINVSVVEAEPHSLFAGGAEDEPHSLFADGAEDELPF